MPQVLAAHITSVYLALEEVAASAPEGFDDDIYDVLLSVQSDTGGPDDVAIAMSDDAEGVIAFANFVKALHTRYDR